MHLSSGLERRRGRKGGKEAPARNTQRRLERHHAAADGAVVLAASRNPKRRRRPRRPLLQERHRAAAEEAMVHAARLCPSGLVYAVGCRWQQGSLFLNPTSLIDLGHGDLGQGRVGDAAGAVGEGRAGGEVQTLGFVIFCRASRMDRHGRRGVRIQSISSQTSPTARALALQHAKTADFQQPQRGIRSRPALTRCRRQTSRSPGRRTGVGVGAGLGRVGKQVAAAGGPVSGDGEETDPS